MIHSIHNIWHKPKWIDRKRRRQAEFLIYRKLELDYISEIAVFNRQKYDRVQQLLNKFGVSTPVVVKPEWYFEV